MWDRRLYTFLGLVMNKLALALFVLGSSLIATTPADTSTPTEGAIIPCELASNQRMANFRGAEPLGHSESAALLFFCLASKTTDNASLQSNLLKGTVLLSGTERWHNAIQKSHAEVGLTCTSAYGDPRVYASQKSYAKH